MTTAVQLAQSVAPGVSLGFKNRIINGSMMIDQRNSGAAITAAGYPVDRWYNYVSQSSKASVGRSTTAPVGFANSLGVTSSSSYSVLSSDYFMLYQGIEGFNWYDMGWGTINAKTVTLSFWVQSSLTGTFGGSMQNWNQDRSYPFTYTISSPNTWEYKTITIPGDTGGTWVGASNAGAAEVNFSYGMGTTKSGTAGAWAAGNYLSVTGATSVVGTNGATFYITGVQLEVGTAATSFEFRDYGRELIMCQRYYYKNKGSGSYQPFGSGYTASSTLAVIFVPYPVIMRTAPGALEQSGTASDYQVNTAPSSQNCSSVPTHNTASEYGAYVTLTVSSGLTTGYAVLARTNAAAPGYLAWSAEL